MTAFLIVAGWTGGLRAFKTNLERVITPNAASMPGVPFALMPALQIRF